MHKYLTEFIGTFVLVLTISLSTYSCGNLAPLAAGAALMMMVYMGRHVSGAHYNPAVTFAMNLHGKLSFLDTFVYVVVQIAGAVAASSMANCVLGIPVEIKPADATAISDAFGAFLIEMFYTCALVLVVFNVSIAKKTEGNSFYGLAIGSAFTAAVFAGGSISGGAFNPAIGSGLMFANVYWGGGTYQFLWLYWIAPLIGGLIAALVFKFQQSGSTIA